jgi:hypothetical protein
MIAGGFEEEDEDDKNETHRKICLRTKGIPQWTSHLHE